MNMFFCCSRKCNILHICTEFKRKSLVGHSAYIEILGLTFTRFQPISRFNLFLTTQQHLIFTPQSSTFMFTLQHFISQNAKLRSKKYSLRFFLSVFFKEFFFSYLSVTLYSSMQH